MNTSVAGKMYRHDLRLPGPYRDPSGDLEAGICQAFASALNLDRVGADDEFFDLGGDSLTAEAVAIEISALTSREIKVSWLANHGTPAKIAGMLSKAPATPPGGRREDAPPPVFAVHGRHGFILPRPEIMTRLAPGQEMKLFEFPGIRGQGESPDRVEEAAALYIRELNETYPEGPVYLMGFCTGGLVAIEMVAQLQAQGRHIELFVLGDPSLPIGIVKNMRLPLPGAGWSPDAGFLAKLKWRLRRIPIALTVGRWTDGTRDEDLADDRLLKLHQRYYRLQLYGKKLSLAIRRKTRFAHVANPTLGHAKLLASFLHYKPRRYDGPVSILVSARQRPLIPVWKHVMPQAEIISLDGVHSEAIAMAATLFGERVEDKRKQNGAAAQVDAGAAGIRNPIHPEMEGAGALAAMKPAE